MQLGPYNLSGEWTGVMGHVVNGKYPISLSVWYWLKERQEILDFVPIIKENFVLTILPKPNSIDFGVFIR